MPGFELALVQWLVLRHELPDQHVFDHRIIARNELIARFQDALSRIASPCRQPQRLPRERFRRVPGMLNSSEVKVFHPT